MNTIQRNAKRPAVCQEQTAAQTIAVSTGGAFYAASAQRATLTCAVPVLVRVAPSRSLNFMLPGSRHAHTIRVDLAACTTTNLGSVLLAIFLVWVVVLYVHATKSSSTTKIAMNFVQVGALMIRPGSHELSWVHSLGAVFTFSPMQGAGVTAKCPAPLDFYGQMLVSVLTPLFCIALLGLTLALDFISRLQTARILQQERSSVPLPRVADYVRTALALLLFSYISVFEAAVSYLACFRLPGTSEPLVHAAPYIACDSDEYVRWRPWMWMVLILHGVGLPLGLHFWASGRLSAAVRCAGTAGSSPLPSKWSEVARSLLTSQYKRHASAWEVTPHYIACLPGATPGCSCAASAAAPVPTSTFCVLAQVLILTRRGLAFLIFSFARDSSFLLLVTVPQLLLHVSIWPFKEEQDNWVEFASLLTLVGINTQTLLSSTNIFFSAAETTALTLFFSAFGVGLLSAVRAFVVKVMHKMRIKVARRLRSEELLQALEHERGPLVTEEQCDRLRGNMQQERRDSRFEGDAHTIIDGNIAGASIWSAMRVERTVVQNRMNEGIRSIVAEFETAPDEARECLDYVLRQAAGSSDRLFSNSPHPRDCDMQGLRRDRQTEQGQGMRLADFVAHPHACAAGLQDAHVLAVRLFTTAAWEVLSAPLYDLARRAPHPFPVTIAFLADAVKKLRAVGACDGSPTVDLWHSMRNVSSMPSFLRQGGTALAPMSTTTAFDAATSSDGQTELILKLRCFEPVANIACFSCFPEEGEVLFPPCTYILPTGRQYRAQSTSGMPQLHIVEVVPIVFFSAVGVPT